MIIYNTLYEAIKQKLNTVSGIKHIDWFNDQYRNFESEKAIPRKAVFIEIMDPVNWNQMGNDAQEGNMRIKLHCVIYDTKDSPVKSLQFTQDVIKSLQRQDLFYSGGEQLTTELIRDESSMPKRYDQVKVTHVTFNTHVFDTTMVDPTQSVQASFNVQPN